MKKVLLIIVFALSCLSGMAQNANLYFDHIDIKKGLPEGYVRKIVEDAEGYIWLSTQNGLVRFDGYQTKVYQLGDPALNKIVTSNVFTMLMDNKHQIWVSTIGNGLFRYNRAKDNFDQFVYPVKEVSQFSIQTIDKAGNLWGQGQADNVSFFFKFDTLSHRYEIFSNHEKGDHYINAANAFAVNQLPDGSIWLGTNNGLYRYNGPGKALTGYFTNTDQHKFRGFYPVYGPPSEPGIIWANSFLDADVDLNIIRLDIRTRQVTTYKHNPDDPTSIRSDSIYTIFEDSKRQLWFGTQNGLSKFDRKLQRFTNYALNDTLRKVNRNAVETITESGTGGLWLSTNTGLAYFNPATGGYHLYRADTDNPEGALSSENIASLLIDRTKTPWIGIVFGGANKVNRVKGAFRIYNQKTAKASGYPGGPMIVSSANGYNYATGRQALFQWRNDGTFKKIFEPAVDGGVIESVCHDPRGTIYVGTSNGLCSYNPTTGQTAVYRKDALDSTTICTNRIGALLMDHTGILWVGSQDQQGICSFDPATKKFKRYPFKSQAFSQNIGGALDDSGVTAVYEDHEGTVWVGTNWGSLNRFNRQTQKFSSFFNKQNAGLSCITSIFEDKHGRFWAGTYMNGLFEVDRKKETFIRHYTEAGGLLYNGIIGVSEDDQGLLWIHSQRGLSRFEPQTGRIKNFNVNHILPGYSINSRYPIAKLANGELAFTVDNGIVAFNPKELTDNPYPPVVHITDISYGNSRSGDKDAENVLAFGRSSLNLAYNQNRLTFNYVGLHYDNPAENTYAYKLDGYDKNWINAGTQRSVTYTNLPPGHYTFMVKAANSDGVWTANYASLPVVINWPWWFTWWSVLLYIALFCFAVYWFIKYRSRRLIEENRTLEEKVSLRTRQLSEHQEEITAQRDQLAETVSDLKTTQQQLIQSEKMASLGELTAGIAHEIQNPLNFVNNFSEVNIEMIDEMEMELDKGDKDEALAIAADIKQNLEKILYHGKRADGIVRGMLQHSRASSNVKEPVDINALADEYLRLAYHGLRAKDKSFNSELTTNFAGGLPMVNAVPQDFGRVLLNLFNNAFYAVQQKQKTAPASYKPTVELTTRLVTAGQEKMVVITVKDNGSGIPEALKDKVMQPFFTTKPTGQGTGLGLSLSYDIVVKGHGGKISVDSREGEFTEFNISLPL